MQTFRKVKRKHRSKYYTVWVKFTEEGHLDYRSSCDCRYGSFYRFTEENKKDKWICRHMVKAYADVLQISPEKAREILIKQGLLNPEHIKTI